MLPRLTPDESKLLSATLARPVALKYFFFADGLVSIEPKTGALIDVHAQREGVAVQPDLNGVAALQPLLDKYSAIPSVKAVVRRPGRLGGAPIPRSPRSFTTGRRFRPRCGPPTRLASRAD